MTPVNNFLSSIIAAALLCIGSAGANAEMPLIEDARIIQPPPGANVAAAYFTLRNTSDAPLHITGANPTGKVIDKAEIHRSFVENDVAKMEKQDNITVPAGESIKFEHGSFHLMLMGLTAPLQPGHSIDIELETSNGPLAFSVPVLSPDEADSSMKAMRHGMSEDHTMEGMDTEHKMGDGHNMDVKKKMKHEHTMDHK